MKIIRPFTTKVSTVGEFVDFINQSFDGHLPNTAELRIDIDRAGDDLYIDFYKNNYRFARCTVNPRVGSNVKATCYYNPQKTVFYFNCQSSGSSNTNIGAIIVQGTNGDWSVIDGWEGRVWCYIDDSSTFTYNTETSPRIIVDGKGLFAFHKEMNYITGNIYKDLYKTDRSPIEGLENNVFVSADEKIFYGATMFSVSLTASSTGGSSTVKYYYPYYFFEALTEEG